MDYLFQKTFAQSFNKNKNKNKGMIVCQNFERPALTSSYTKFRLLRLKNSFATIVNELVSAFKWRFNIFVFLRPFAT